MYTYIWRKEFWVDVQSTLHNVSLVMCCFQPPTKRSREIEWQVKQWKRNTVMFKWKTSFSGMQAPVQSDGGINPRLKEGWLKTNRAKINFQIITSFPKSRNFWYKCCCFLGVGVNFWFQSQWIWIQINGFWWFGLVLGRKCRGRNAWKKSCNLKTPTYFGMWQLSQEKFRNEGMANGGFVRYKRSKRFLAFGLIPHRVSTKISNTNHGDSNHNGMC